MILKELLEMWLNEKKIYVKPSTYSYYSYEANHYIIPLLGDISLETICEDDIQNTVLLLQKQGIANGHPLNKSTIQNLVVLLKQAVKFGVRKNLLKNMKIEIHFAPQSPPNKQKVFCKTDQNKLIHALLDDLNYKSFGILLCLNTGLRIGELCALKWKDIDMNMGIVRITKTLQRVYKTNQHQKTCIIIASPKTQASIREVPLSQRMLAIINSLHYTNPDFYVLSNSMSCIEPRRLRAYYNKFLSQNGIQELNFHCLRHTFATRLVESGADYKSISEILGHSSINMTLNMYVHPLIEEKRKCVELIEWD